MLSLVQELTKPKRELFKIKAVKFFAANVMMATFEDVKKPMPSTSEYVAMEHRIARAWHHAPAYGFLNAPDVGTFVMVMEPRKSNFKRGAIFNVDCIAGTMYYDVFLYDWGLIKRYTLRDLAKLPASDTHSLPPRTFLVVAAGMLETSKGSREQEDGTEFNHGQDKLDNDAALLGDHPRKVASRNRAIRRALKWMEKRSRIYLDIFKSFDDIIYTGDIKGVRQSTMEAGDLKHECYASGMRKHQYLHLDRNLRREDKDPQASNWDAVAARLEVVIPREE